MTARLLGGPLAAGLVLASASDAQAQFYFGYSSYYPATYYPSGYYGPYPGYYTAYGAPAFHGSVFPAPAPAFYGPDPPYPAYYGGYGYTYSYFTHVPGYSFTYYRGRVPRYYPGPYGYAGYGFYGYGPYGW